MFAQLLFLASLCKLYASPIDPNHPLPQVRENILNTRDTASGTGDHLRTTYEIVWSCLVTILACVWSAVHPNIPGPFDGRWTTLKRRIRTTLCALIAPELMVMWALHQHFAAKKIKEEYNQIFVLQDLALDQPATWESVFKWLASAKNFICELVADQPHDTAVRRQPRLIKTDEPLRDREPWTMTHGFFVQMGGFMLYENEKPKEVLEFNDICLLIRSGQIAAPTVTEAELKDRSKGNPLSKCVIVLQTLWFVVQCLARLASRLPLSELEVITLGFAVLNGIVYWLWWDKPQGVVIAISIHLQFPDGHGNGSTETAAAHDTENPPPSRLNSEGQSEAASLAQEKSGTDAQVKEATILLSYAMEDTSAQDISFSETAPSEESLKTHRLMTQSQLQVETESSTSRTLFTNSRAIKLWNTLKTAMIYPFDQLYGMILDEGISQGDMQVPTFYVHDLDVDNKLMTIAVVIGTLFGAVHFFAWASVFQLHVEQLVWHVSVLITTAGPVTFLLLFLVDEADDPPDIEGIWWQYVVSIIVVVTAVPCSVATVAYIPARIALLTVALLSLRSIPQDALTQVVWTSFIPHF